MNPALRGWGALGAHSKSSEKTPRAGSGSRSTTSSLLASTSSKPTLEGNGGQERLPVGRVSGAVDRRLKKPLLNLPVGTRRNVSFGSLCGPRFAISFDISWPGQPWIALDEGTDENARNRIQERSRRTILDDLKEVKGPPLTGPKGME